MCIKFYDILLHKMRGWEFYGKENALRNRDCDV